MAKKFGLGKGLNALLPESEEASGPLDSIDINRIKPNKEQPRKYFDEEKIYMLSESIKEHGMIQPIIVKKDGDDYRIIAGERRWRAARKAGLKEIPVIMMDLSEKDVLEISLIENIQRQDLNPMEEASAFKRLLDDFNLTQEDLSKKLGKSRTAIANTIRLLNLDSRVQEFLIEGILSEGHGRALLGLENYDEQYLASQKVIDFSLSVRETEHLVAGYHTEKVERNKKALDPYLADLEKRLGEALGTRVKFKAKAKNKGKIEIEYYSSDELERILEFLKVED